MKAFFEEFKKFMSLGNIMDMAIGVIIGGAFGTIVKSLVDDILMPLLGIAGGTATSASNYGARVFSSLLNFALNRRLVFKTKNAKGAFWKYIATCVLIIVLSTLGIKALSALGMAKWLAKIICDTLLYFLSYRIQRSWVFKEKQS